MSNRKCPGLRKTDQCRSLAEAGDWQHWKFQENVQITQRKPRDRWKVQCSIREYFFMEIFSCVVAMMLYFFKDIFCVSSGYFPALKDQQIVIICYIVPGWLLLFLHNGLDDRQVFLFLCSLTLCCWIQSLFFSPSLSVSLGIESWPSCVLVKCPSPSSYRF